MHPYWCFSKNVPWYTYNCDSDKPKNWFLYITLLLKKSKTCQRTYIKPSILWKIKGTSQRILHKTAGSFIKPSLLWGVWKTRTRGSLILIFLKKLKLEVLWFQTFSKTPESQILKLDPKVINKIEELPNTSSHSCSAQLHKY